MWSKDTIHGHFHMPYHSKPAGFEKYPAVFERNKPIIVADKIVTIGMYLEHANSVPKAMQKYLSCHRFDTNKNTSQ